MKQAKNELILHPFIFGSFLQNSGNQGTIWKQGKKEYKMVNKSIFISLLFTTSTYKFNNSKKCIQLQYTFYRGDNGFLRTEESIKKPYRL